MICNLVAQGPVQRVASLHAGIPANSFPASASALTANAECNAPYLECATFSHLCYLSSPFAQVRQFSPVATGIDPDRAIGAKGDDLAGRQRSDLLDLAAVVRW
jgi:hypothetical protein